MTTNKSSPFVILSSPETSDRASRVAERLNRLDSQGLALYSHTQAEYTRFESGEIFVRIPDTVRSKDVYFMHSPFYPDPNTGLIKMLLTNNAVRLASARSITLIIPYMPYQRQDRKDQPRVPISAKVMAKLIETNQSVKRVITMDMHAEQEEGFFDIPVDNLRGRVLFEDYYRNMLNDDFSNVMVIAPDFGAGVRARRFAKLIGDVPVGIIEKERRPGQEVTMHKYIGPDLGDRLVILLDDMIDTGGSIITAARALRKLGAGKVEICATHAVFSPTEDSSAEEKLSKEGLRVVVTDSIPRDTAYEEKHRAWLTVLPTEDLIVKVIQQSDTPGGSVSTLC